MRFNPKKFYRNDRRDAEARAYEAKQKKRVEHVRMVVAWEIAEGVPGRQVAEFEIRNRVTELGILHWGSNEFSDYQKRVFEKYPLPKGHELTPVSP